MSRLDKDSKGFRDLKDSLLDALFEWEVEAKRTGDSRIPQRHPSSKELMYRVSEQLGLSGPEVEGLVDDADIAFKELVKEGFVEKTPEGRFHMSGNGLSIVEKRGSQVKLAMRDYEKNESEGYGSATVGDSYKPTRVSSTPRIPIPERKKKPARP